MGAASVQKFAPRCESTLSRPHLTSPAGGGIRVAVLIVLLLTSAASRRPHLAAHSPLRRSAGQRLRDSQIADAHPRRRRLIRARVRLAATCRRHGRGDRVDHRTALRRRIALPGGPRRSGKSRGSGAHAHAARPAAAGAAPTGRPAGDCCRRERRAAFIARAH